MHEFLVIFIHILASDLFSRLFHIKHFDCHSRKSSGGTLMMALYHLGAPANQAYDQASEGACTIPGPWGGHTWDWNRAINTVTNSTCAMTSQHVCYKLHFEKKRSFCCLFVNGLVAQQVSQQEIHRCFNYWCVPLKGDPAIVHAGSLLLGHLMELSHH